MKAFRTEYQQMEAIFTLRSSTLQDFWDTRFTGLEKTCHQ